MSSFTPETPCKHGDSRQTPRRKGPGPQGIQTWNRRADDGDDDDVMMAMAIVDHLLDGIRSQMS